MAIQSEHSSIDLSREALRDLIGKWDGEVPGSPAATTLLFILQNLAVRVARLEDRCARLDRAQGLADRDAVLPGIAGGASAAYTQDAHAAMVSAWENYVYQRESPKVWGSKDEEIAKVAFEAGWRSGYLRALPG